MDIHGYKFDFIGRINDFIEYKNGKIYEYSSFAEYDNKENLKLNQYGRGPFCRFKIPENLRYPGVYCIIINNEVIYIGECYDFAQRFNAGYGNISPRNCFVNGQSTNCKLNSFILTEHKKGNKIELYFYKTNDFKRIEYHLIRELHPKLNLRDNPINSVIEPNRVKVEQNRETYFKENREKVSRSELRTVKYEDFYHYLVKQNQNEIKITIDSIEKIVGFKLPKSAYVYSAWWANEDASHSHASSWLAAGYKVKFVKFGEYTIFKKV